MKIRIGFSRARSTWAVGSRAIQIAEKRDYSHALVLYQDPITGQLMVFQAANGMVHQLPYEDFLKHNMVVKLYKVPQVQNQVNRFWAAKNRLSGRKYSRLSIAILTCMKLIGLKKYYKLDGDAAYICSELVASLDGLGMPEATESLDVFTPSDLEKLLQDLGLEETLVET